MDILRPGYDILEMSTRRTSARTGIFQSNRSQAVRLPKEVAFPEKVKQVTVIRDGKRRILAPSESLWDDFFDAPGLDLGARGQAEVEMREEL